MDVFTAREKKIFGVLVLCILIGSSIYIGKQNERDNDFNTSDTAVSTDNNLMDEHEESKPAEAIYIHISGAVEQGGLLKLEAGSRLIDAINLAGGATDQADLNKVNLAEKLTDEARIHIPAYGEESSVELTSYSEASAVSEFININTATKEELMNLPGIGEKTAEKIIDYREKTSFEVIEDIMEVPGIGDKKFEDLKDRIAV